MNTIKSLICRAGVSSADTGLSLPENIPLGVNPCAQRGVLTWAAAWTAGLAPERPALFGSQALPAALGKVVFILQ